MCVSCISKNRQTGSGRKGTGWFRGLLREAWARCWNQPGTGYAPCTPVTSSSFVDRNGKCRSSPALLEIRKRKFKENNKGKWRMQHLTTLELAGMWKCLFTPAAVQTWREVGTNSERGRGGHVFVSQELFSGGSTFDCLETLCGILEEEVLSTRWLEHSERVIIAVDTKLGLGINIKWKSQSGYLFFFFVFLYMSWVYIKRKTYLSLRVYKGVCCNTALNIYCMYSIHLING